MTTANRCGSTTSRRPRLCQPTFWRNCSGELKNARLVVSRRGVQGGFLLGRAPDQITLYDIIQAMEGDLLELSGNHEGKSGRKLKTIWNDIRGAAIAKARGYTLEAMAAKTEAEMYFI
jgi:Rrf2 family cysteine metabolism transcriptional repressor